MKPPANNPLVIVTGYSDRPLSDSVMTPAEFFKLWFKNTILPGGKYVLHRRVYVINSGGKPPEHKHGLEWINGESLDATLDGQICDWSSSLMLGCLLAYQNKADLLYKDQSCLAFGPWLDRLYHEIGGSGLICGGANDDGAMGHSLILVKNEFLLPLATEFLAIRTKCAPAARLDIAGDAAAASEASMPPADKLAIVEKAIGGFAHTSMGVDRSRPLDLTAESFYLQQPSDAELAELKARRLL